MDDKHTFRSRHGPLDQPWDDTNGKDGTHADQEDMKRMGKTQDLHRNFRFISIFGFSMVMMASWESPLIISSIGLENGGTAGFIWMTLICWIGFILVNTSMAEMGSMAPTTGGQYHWVSEFSSKKYQKFLSYLMGWMCVLGWQTACASSAYMTGTQIQGLIILHNPNYVAQSWHGTLITIAVAIFAVVFNTLLSRKLPLVEGLILVIHVFAFFGVMVTLWVLSPKAEARTVFTQFNNGGGWDSLGTSAIMGITAGALPLLGADAAVHMAEEVRDASKVVPMSMISTTLLNGALQFIMVVTFCFCLGDMDQALSSSTGYPYLEVFRNSTKSTSGATAMAVFIVFISIFADLTTVATASRQLYAFGRDQGLPFSSWFSSIRPGWDIPFNAVIFTFVISSLLSLINIGSSSALNSITSLTTGAFLSSYITSIGCIIWRRWTDKKLPPSKFRLGRWGLPINIASEMFLVVVFVLSFFPALPTPDSENMNWSILIYGAVAIFCLVYYVFRGRHEYVGPVEYVRSLD